jgi:hypothetical protein
MESNYSKGIERRMWRRKDRANKLSQKKNIKKSRLGIGPLCWDGETEDRSISPLPHLCSLGMRWIEFFKAYCSSSKVGYGWTSE